MSLVTPLADLEALRARDWKLHFPHGYRTIRERAPGSGGRPGKYDYGARIELSLFDLASDPAETEDLAAARPDVVRELVGKADVMRARLGDQLTKTTGAEVREPGRRP